MNSALHRQPTGSKGRNKCRCGGFGETSFFTPVLLFWSATRSEAPSSSRTTSFLVLTVQTTSHHPVPNADRQLRSCGHRTLVIIADRSCRCCLDDPATLAHVCYNRSLSMQTRAAENGTTVVYGTRHIAPCAQAIFCTLPCTNDIQHPPVHNDICLHLARGRVT